MCSEELEFNSYTYGRLTLDGVADKIKLYYDSMSGYDEPFNIVVGTDSQNFSDTKVVNVIAVTCKHHGGIFFYRINRMPKIVNVRQKLQEETLESLNIMTLLVDILAQDEYAAVFNGCTFTIHIDAGLNPRGKTSELIPELVGWIKAMGYDCEVKPNSFAASSIADKISK